MNISSYFTKLSIIISLCLVLYLPGMAQSKLDQEPVKYWIFLTDKQVGKEIPTGFKADHITERALDRRHRRGRYQAVTRYDLPVPATYTDQLESLGIEPIVTSRWFNAVSAYLSPDQLARVQALPFVKQVQPVGRMVEPMSAAVPVPVAPLAPVQTSYDYGSSFTQLALMNAIVPLEHGYNGTGVRMGFLDTTFDFNHPAFQQLQAENRLIAVTDFAGPQTNKHGLNTTSTAFAFHEGNLIGACHGAEVLAASTEFAPTETNQEEDNLVAGLEWMESMGADIVNISLGYSTFDIGQNSYTYADMDGDTAIPSRAVDLAAAMGIAVFTSAGNEAGCGNPDNCWYYVLSPADADSAIAIGAVHADSLRSSFSSIGPTADGRTKPDLVAMGSGVTIAHQNGGYSSSSGTSFSSPLAASVGCQVLQANPNLNPIELRDALRNTASLASKHQSPDNFLGWGVINALAAVEAVGGSITAAEDEAVPNGGFSLDPIYPNPVSGEIMINFNAPTATPVRVHIYDVLGRTVQTLFDGTARAGSNMMSFNADALPAGLYILQLEGRGVSASQKMIRLQ